MQFRKFKKTGEDVSLFGLGTMRMPINDDGSVNKEASIDMIRTAIDNGVNYVDTAHMYHNSHAETVVGEALKDGYREKVFLTTKLPLWLAKSEDELETIFQKQLKDCQTDYFDFYLLHNTNSQVMKLNEKYNAIDFLDKKKKEGKIKNLGFSHHDTCEMFEEIIEMYPWDFCQIQLNYMDKEFQAGIRGYNYATSKGIPVIIMEPVKGGKLVDNVPPTVMSIWNSSKTNRKPVDWALRWVANFDNVLTILCGVHSKEQLLENIEILKDAKANSLSNEELQLIDKASDEYNRLIKYSCTSCNYCLPCPVKINIPGIIGYRNDWEIYAGTAKVAADYKTWNHPKRLASACTNCGLCKEKCPQRLDIPAIMIETAEIFDK